MSNKDKRAKRAKLKAKESRIKKHQEKSNTARRAVEVVRFSPEFIALFKTLPDFSKKYECTPLIREFVENNAEMEDSQAGVAMIFVFYAHWSTTGSDSIDRTELAKSTDFLLEQAEFIDSF